MLGLVSSAGSAFIKIRVVGIKKKQNGASAVERTRHARVAFGSTRHSILICRGSGGYLDVFGGREVGQRGRWQGSSLSLSL